MMSIITQCPKCGLRQKARQDQFGLEILCADCKTTFVIHLAAAEPIDSLAAAAPRRAPTQAIRVEPSVGASAVVDEWFVRTPEGTQHGPATRDQLLNWLAERRISASHMIRNKSWDHWKEAAEVFRQLAISAPLYLPRRSNPAADLESVDAAAPVHVRTSRPRLRRKTNNTQQWIAIGLGVAAILLVGFFVVFFNRESPFTVQKPQEREVSHVGTSGSNSLASETMNPRKAKDTQGNAGSAADRSAKETTDTKAASKTNPDQVHIMALQRLGARLTNGPDGKPVKVDLSRIKIEPEDLQHIVALGSVRDLDISYCGITDLAFNYLREMRSLEKLNLAGNPSSWSAQETFMQYLQHTRIGDGISFIGLNVLTNAKLPRLKELNLTGSTYACGGVIGKFQQAYPDCRVITEHPPAAKTIEEAPSVAKSELPKSELPKSELPKSDHALLQGRWKTSDVGAAVEFIGERMILTLEKKEQVFRFSIESSRKLKEIDIYRPGGGLFAKGIYSLDNGKLVLCLRIAIVEGMATKLSRPAEFQDKSFLHNENGVPFFHIELNCNR